jgi:hypothetical protein
MEDVGRSGDIAPPFLTAALDGGEWYAPAVLVPGKEAPISCWTGGLVDPRTDLKDWAKMTSARVSMEISFHRNPDESTPPALSIILR